MKFIFIRIISTYFLLGLFYPISISYGQQQNQRIYMAVEFNKVLCGYSEIVTYDTIIDNETLIFLDQYTFFNFTAIGRDMTQYQNFTFCINPETGNFTHHTSYQKQADIEMEGEVIVDGNQLTSKSEGKDKIISGLSSDVVLPNMQFYYYLLEDFCNTDLKEKTYNMYDLRAEEIIESTYHKIGEEDLNLNGEIYQAMKFSQKDYTSGLETVFWIDKNDGMRLKMESQSRLAMYITDSRVKTKIKKGSWDDVIFIKTNEKIWDIRNITSMKVKVDMDPIPVPHIEDLSVKGQTFTGSIENGKMAGIFEISRENYAGKNADSFPFDVANYTDLEVYLIASSSIESDDSVLIELSHRITSGSKDVWEASHRLAKWVADTIDGAILSGTALQTFNRKKGDCGSQSFLMAALCRASGIPARVAYGSMYTREYDGSFGSHAWNEIFMGKGGWISIDVTLDETDYIDAGHIRIGIIDGFHTVLNYNNIEILDFEIGKLR